MSDLKGLLDAEGRSVERAESDQDSPRSSTKTTRGHERSRTLQIRLNEEELADLVALAEDRKLPVSTVARHLLLQSLAPSDDLRSALDRLERDVLEVRRKALSA